MVQKATQTLPPPIVRLASQPDSVSYYKLWRALPVEDKKRAIEWTLRDAPDSIRADLTRAIARGLNFRERTVQKWSESKIAERGSRLEIRRTHLLTSLLIHLHLHGRREMLVQFLDDVGLPNEDGILTEEAYEHSISTEELHVAADRLWQEHAPDHVVVYFLTMLLQGVPSFEATGDWLETKVEAIDSAIGEADSPLLEEPEEEEAVPSEGSDEFTTLDLQLIRTIVDVAQGIDGALSPDELDDLIDEITSLNSSRHRSWFHVGFCDIVLEQPERKELPAQNVERMKWYHTGCITGLARYERWDEITQLHDENETVRELGKGETGPEPLVAPLVFRALCRNDRPGEAAAFLDPRMVSGSPRLFHELSGEGTRLLRESRAPEARGVFDLLGKTIARLEREGMDVSTRPFLEAHRRRAHCFRQLGEMKTAEELLETLLERETNPDIRAMVLADLGLIDAGFRTLIEVEMPQQEDEIEAYRESLERGEGRFQEAADLARRGSAHGQYCLAILALLREAPGPAVEHLDLALSVFEAEPDRYGKGGVLSHARLHLGIALCLDVRADRFRRAAEFIQSALATGHRPPLYLVPRILTSLSLSSESLAEETADAILSEFGNAALDYVLESGAVPESPPVATALLERARHTFAGETARFRDYLRALPLLLIQDRVEEASAALDFMEATAEEGVETEAFLELLQDPGNYEPVWSRQDALWSRVRLLRSIGRFDQAQTLLEQEFYRILASESFGFVEDAEGVLERIETFAVDEDSLEPLRARLAAVSEKREPVEDSREEAPKRVNVLFIGGDETQEQYDAQIREELAEEHPRIEASFFHPKWKSNWGAQLDHVKGLLPDHDAAVVTRHVRTEFGRQVRKALEIPWRGCSGTGRKAMKTSIVLAAEMARSRDLEAGSA